MTNLHRLQKRRTNIVHYSTDEADGTTCTKRTISVFDTSHVFAECTYFLCDESDEKETLFYASTFTLDFHIKECAQILCDGLLLAKLSRGDVIALEAKHHKGCLTSLYNRVRAQKRKDLNSGRGKGTEKIMKSIVFAELVSFVKDSKTDDLAPVLKLSELKKLYIKRLRGTWHVSV